MSTEWHLPPAHESGMYKSYKIAKSLIEDFAEGRFAPPAALVTSVKDYLCGQGEAKDALRRFTIQLSGSNEDFDPSDDPKIQATLVIAIVMAWASSQTESQHPNFRELIRHSWWIESLWAEVALVVAQKNGDFKEAILNLADQNLADAEKKLLEEYGVAPNHPTTLDEIWHGNSRESQSDQSSWAWIELLARLDKNKLFNWMNSTRSLVFINRLLDSPEFYRNYDLWESFTLKVSTSFENDGKWNGALLLPSLIRHGSETIIHVAGGHEYPPSVLEPHVKSVLARFVDTVGKRSDFEGLFKRWGTWLTRQHLNFPDNNSGRKKTPGQPRYFLGINS